MPHNSEAAAGIISTAAAKKAGRPALAPHKILNGYAAAVSLDGAHSRRAQQDRLYVIRARGALGIAPGEPTPFADSVLAELGRLAVASGDAAARAVADIVSRAGLRAKQAATKIRRARLDKPAPGTVRELSGRLAATAEQYRRDHANVDSRLVCASLDELRALILGGGNGQ